MDDIRSKNVTIKYGLPLLLAVAFLVFVLPAISQGPVSLLLVKEFSLDEWGGYRWARRLWLFPHAAGATIAVLIGPAQFAASLRMRLPRAHRILGRVYVVSSVIAAGSALVLSLRMGNANGRWSSLLLSLLWSIALILGLIAVRSRRFTLHRDLMIRTYIFMLAFVFFGIFRTLLSGALGGTPDGARLNLDWMYWLVPWAATEVWLAWIRPLFLPASPSRHV